MILVWREGLKFAKCKSGLRIIGYVGVYCWPVVGQSGNRGASVWLFPGPSGDQCCLATHFWCIVFSELVGL